MEQADSVQEVTGIKATTTADAREGIERTVWTLKRQCSATSHQFTLAYGVVAAIILGTASLCALAGAWLVLPCALVETLAIGGMCWLYTRRERDYDCIELFDGTLNILRTNGNRVDRVQLNPIWVNIALGTGRNPKIEIRYAGSIIAVGSQVPLEVRQLIVTELNRKLSTLRARVTR